MVYGVHKLVDATKKKKFREIVEKMLHMVEDMWFCVWPEISMHKLESRSWVKKEEWANSEGSRFCVC